MRTDMDKNKAEEAKQKALLKAELRKAKNRDEHLCRELLKCPYSKEYPDPADLLICRSCPGPKYFLSGSGLHECTKCKLFKLKDFDERCKICKGAAVEPNHHGENTVSIDSFGRIPGKPLCLGGSPSCIALSPEDTDKARAALRFFTGLDELTFGYVRGTLHGGELMALYDVSDERKAALAKAQSFTSGVEKRVADVFLSMTQDEFAIVKHLLSGGNLNTYATVYNTKRQYAFNKMRELMRRSHPEIRAIVKERKQLNGRTLKRAFSKDAQMGLF